MSYGVFSECGSLPALFSIQKLQLYYPVYGYSYTIFCVLLKTTVNFAEDANNELDHQIRKKPSFLQSFKVRKRCR